MMNLNDAHGGSTWFSVMVTRSREKETVALCYCDNTAVIRLWQHNVLCGAYTPRVIVSMVHLHNRYNHIYHATKAR